MADGIELTINAMQAAHRAYLRTAAPRLQAPDLAQYPTSLQTASLPMLLVWPGEGRWYLKGDGFGMDERTMLITAYVGPLAQDDIPSRAVEAVRLIEPLKNLWLSRTPISLVDPGTNAGGYQVTVESSFGNGHSDGGLTSGPVFSGVQYTGFVIRVLVRISWTVAQV